MLTYKVGIKWPQLNKDGMAWMNSTDLDSNIFGQIENTMSNACGCNKYILAVMAGGKELPSNKGSSEIFYMHFISLIPSNG